ncbi:MAG TPA: hypothetical protein VGB38_06300 [bacterium]
MEKWAILSEGEMESLRAGKFFYDFGFAIGRFYRDMWNEIGSWGHSPSGGGGGGGW